MTDRFTKGELLWIALTLFFVPFVHLLGLLLAGLGAYDRWHEDRGTAFVILVLLGVIAAGLEIVDLL